MNKKAILSDDIIVHQALDCLAEQAGFAGEWHARVENSIDGDLTLTIPSCKLTFHAEVKKTLRQQQLPDIYARATDNQPFILIVEELFPKLKTQLREQNVAYLDGVGNLFLNWEGNYIWIDGNKPAKARKRLANRAFTKAGLKVIFHLLTHENALKTTYRDIAASSAAALGNIGLIINGLKESGFLIELNKSEVVLRNKRVLLEKWIDGYRQTLKPSLYIGDFNFTNKAARANWKGLSLLTGDSWGGEAAGELTTNYLSAEILTLYSQHNRPEIMKTWKLIPKQEGGLKAYQKFWFDGEEVLDITPHLLTYADLMISDDPRCFETADIIYNTHLKQFFDEEHTTQSSIRST